MIVTGCTSAREPALISGETSPAVGEVAADSPVVDRDTATEEGLWTALAQAEEETYVVLLRHAIAPGTGDPEAFQLNDCSTQRNLSAEGRQQAKAIGEAFRSRER